MPTQGLPEHHSTCKGLSPTKKNTEPELVSKHPVGPQCCSTLLLTGLTKAQTLPRPGGLYPPVLGHSVWDRALAPLQLGQPFTLRKRGKHGPASPLPSTALSPVLSSGTAAPKSKPGRTAHSAGKKHGKKTGTCCGDAASTCSARPCSNPCQMPPSSSSQILV